MKLQKKFALFIAGHIALIGSVYGQIETIAAQRAIVVKIRVSRPEQGDETAAGILVGRDQKSAYFVTAYHAIRARKQGTSEVVANDCSGMMSGTEETDSLPGIDVQFSTIPRSTKADILPSYDPGLDLAVLSIPIQNLPSELAIIPLKDAVPDVLIHIIGHPSSGDWSVLTATLSNENAPHGDVHRFITSGVVPGGYSGGPVFDSKGNLYGMHVCSTATYGKAVKISEILALLNAWRVPTNNLSIGGPPPSTFDRSTLQELVELKFVGLIRLRFHGDQYFSTAFGLTSEKTLWQLNKGKYNNLNGYWIFRTDIRQCWQAENANGPLRYWNADGRARGNPEDQELFVFETADMKTGAVRIKNIYGRYVRYSAGAFRCDSDQASAATFTVEFP